jgi:hypothetical protein
MKLLLAVPAVLLVASTPAPAPDLAFALEGGASVTKTIETNLSAVLDEMSFVMNGEEQDAPMDEEISADFGFEVAVTDTYGAAEDGRPSHVVRAYETLRAHGESSDTDEGFDEELGDLSGKAVKFTWNAETSEYDAAWEGDAGDDDLLGVLREDLDYRMLLPDGEVSAGGSWEVDGAHLPSVLLPGVSLAGLMSDSGPLELDQSIELDWDEIFSTAEGTFTFKGTEGDLATIEMVWEFDTSLDIDPADVGIPEDGPEVALLQVDPSLRLEGVLVWNTARGRFESLSYEGEGEISVEVEMSISFGEDSLTFEQGMVFGITLQSESTASE